MIKLKIEDYCHGCIEFVSEDIQPTSFFNCNGVVTISDPTCIIVRCEHSDLCTRIKNHLENVENRRRDENDQV